MAQERLSDFDVPWCQTLLKSPDVEDVSTADRRPPPPTNQDVTNTLFSETWHTDTTVRAYKLLKRRRHGQPEEFLILLSLGTGLGGYRDVLHGGAAAALIDQNLGRTSNASAGPCWTKETTLRYNRSVPLPALLLCRTVVTRADGRSLWLRSTLETSAGDVCVQADSLCVLIAKDGRKEKKGAETKL